jgi:RecB family exonuclease
VTRAERLIVQLLEWELSREPFSTHVLEWAQPFVIAGATLSLRLDRVDRLAHGRLAVIDYKSGTPERFEPWAERPPRPQLPVYATIAGAQSAPLPQLQAVPARDEASAWPQLLAHWQEQIHSLVQEYLSGQAAVQPQPGACDYCHLQMLCRVNPAELRAAQDPDSNEPPPSADDILERVGSDS